jgi:ribonuclease J
MPLVEKSGDKFEFKRYEKLPGPELAKQKILPDVSGFYEWDKESKPIDGVLISHPHIDHYGFFGYLRKDICFYLGEAAKKLIDLSVIFTPVKGTIHKYKTIESGKSFTIGDFTVTPYLMDHSGFDSYAFLIEADGKSLLYSGDFREHGRKPSAFKRFLRNAPENIDALLLEGTMFGRKQGAFKTEQDIEAKTTELASKTKNIIFLHFSPQNIDRLVSFYKASRRTQRLFVIDPYAANVLDTVKDFGHLPHPSLDYENIRVFFPTLLCQRLKNHGHEKLFYKFKKYKITKDEISHKRSQIMMLVRASMLINLRGIDNLEGATFIYSMWKGYLGYESNKELLDFIKSKEMEFHHIHTSGHASIQTLEKVVKKLKPKNTIPIHTFHPDQYKIFGDNVKLIADGEVYEV